ncbi:MAG: cytochrome P450 [Deltaproteobacteria bacterium]|nr:cytochrome P450 [Deltaproteobacteria bacterium]
MTAAAPDFSNWNIVERYPHDIWRWMRANDPVFWWDKTDGRPFWAITKHADITTIGKRPTQFLNAPRLTIEPTAERDPDREMAFPPTLIQLDPPKHGIYRRLISNRFTPRALKRFHHDIDQIGREIVEDLVSEGKEGECDFVEKISAPLPIAVIAWMLGLPKSDWNLLFDWTNRIIGAADPAFQVEGKTPEESSMEAMTEVFMYFSKLVEERKKEPADDLITLFTQMQVDGEPIPPMDVLAWCLIIVIAGNETTRNATTGGMLAFVEHQSELRKLQDDATLLGSAIEEVVRWSTPIIHFARTATEDFELRDKTIRAGDAVALFYPSANRDEEVFEDPYAFRIDRNPNRHLGFGVGEHFCLGAHLARLEMQVAYKYLLPRIEEIELAGPVDRLHSSLVGGVKHLPIRYKLKEA